jgi:hypothetical protein
MKKQWNFLIIPVFKLVRKTNDIGFICQLSNSECGTNLIIFQDLTLCNEFFFYILLILNLPQRRRPMAGRADIYIIISHS